MSNPESTSYLYVLPARWAKRSTIWDLLVRHTNVIESFGVHSIAPPCLNRVQPDSAILRVLQSEEDEKDADGITGIQSSGQQIW
jgi:hypothetical protein